MSTTDRLDLTATVEAAARERYERVRRDRGQAHLGEMPAWHDLSPVHQHGWREGVLNEIAAAAPLIAQQVAEQVAQAIKQERRRYGSAIGESPMPEGSQHSARDGGILYGLDRAARIAREWGEPA